MKPPHHLPTPPKCICAGSFVLFGCSSSSPLTKTFSHCSLAPFLSLCFPPLSASLSLCCLYLTPSYSLSLFPLSLLLTRPLQLGTHVSGSADHQLMYCEAKMAARPYQTVKQQWFRSLQETGLGTWVKKPPEQEQFLLSV